MEESISILESIKTAANQMTWVEVWAVITGLIYVLLAIREIIWCWLFGIISSVLSVYLFYTGKLYAESVLYIYYVVAGVYGWYVWNKQKKIEAENSSDQSQVKIHSWSWKSHIVTIFIGVLLSILLAFILKNYTDAQIPQIDSFTTVFSFIATYMVTRKVLENWLYWIIIDVVTVGMYFDRGFYLYALLMIVYTIMAVLGYISWKQAQKKKVEEKVRI